MDRTSNRIAAHRIWFAGNVSVLIGIWLAAVVTQNFHLRVIWEGIVAAECLLLIHWTVLGQGVILNRVLLTLIGIAVGVLATQLLLKDGFAAWFEVWVWYLPVSISLAMILRFADFEFSRNASAAKSASDKTFSIAAMMIMTLVVAVTIPLVRVFMRSRADGRLDRVLWWTDSLLWVVPVCVIATGLIITTSLRRHVYTGLLILAAPIAGVLIARIYGWDFYESIVWHMLTVSLVVTSQVATNSCKLSTRSKADSNADGFPIEKVADRR